MPVPNNNKDRKTGNDSVLILGGGLAGLSAGYILSEKGWDVTAVESDSAVGGLSKTLEHNGYRFDIGGHRFFTKDERINGFVRDLMDAELLTVERKSKIYFLDRFFDYPLKPVNSVFGLGIPTTAKIIFDYSKERLKSIFGSQPHVSLEDWVVANFGRSMFNLYFKEYSEKVWGIDCSSIDQDWVSTRISGLSLGKAAKHAVFKFTGRNLPTLADSFLYPKMGIGRISERLSEEIQRRNQVLTDTRVEKLKHNGSVIESVTVRNGGSPYEHKADSYISSIPLTTLISSLSPAPPAEIMESVSKLRFRDLVVVTIMVKRDSVTDQTWIYLPEKKIPFGRIHEPKNWSSEMAPEGESLIVTEFFCFKGDEVWNKDDEELVSTTVRHLEALGFISSDEVINGVVLRIPKAYPLFEVGYKEHCSKLMEYLDGFSNMRVAGRGAMFRYYNMDHAIDSGMEAAREVMERGVAERKDGDSK